jgi:hypothetical protein
MQPERCTRRVGSTTVVILKLSSLVYFIFLRLIFLTITKLVDTGSKHTIIYDEFPILMSQQALSTSASTFASLKQKVWTKAYKCWLFLYHSLWVFNGFK